jgi:hypothetical protein
LICWDKGVFFSRAIVSVSVLVITLHLLPLLRQSVAAPYPTALAVPHPLGYMENLRCQNFSCFCYFINDRSSQINLDMRWSLSNLLLIFSIKSGAV